MLRRQALEITCFHSFFIVNVPPFSEHFLVEVVHGIHAMLHVMLHDALVATGNGKMMENDSKKKKIEDD